MKKLILKIVAIVLSAVSFLGLFLDNFISGKLDTAIGTSKPTLYNFQDWFAYVKDMTELKELTWMPIAEYLSYAAFAFAGLIILLVVLQFLIRNKTLNTIVKVVSLLGIVVGAGTLVVLFLGCNEINTVLSTSLGSIVYSLDFGAYATSLGVLAGGIVGLSCTNKIKSKGKKKRK